MSFTISVQLVRPGSAPESFAVEGERVLIGTAAHCEIRLPQGKGAPEHVMLVHGLAGVHAEALALHPAPTIDGAPFTIAPLAGDAWLAVSDVKIRITSVAVPSGGVRAKTTQSKTNPLVYVVAAVLIPYSLVDLLGSRKDDDIAPPKNPPKLFVEGPAACPQSDAELATAFALEQRVLGDSQRERRPFHAFEGVAAVQTYRVASACFDAAGDAGLAAETRTASLELEDELDESYRTHRVRLEHALSTKNFAVARHEIRALLDLTRGKTGEYVSWLASTGRRLKLKEGKEGKNR